MKSICCIGMLVADVTVANADRMPPLGTIKVIDRISAGIGGCASNAAVDLRRLGQDVSVIGMVGNDVFGNFLVDSLRREGVDTAGIVRSDKTATSAAIAMVHSSGERCFYHFRGGNAAFTYEDIDLSVVAGSGILFIGGALYLPHFDGEPTARLLRYAREKGVYTAMDVAWDDSGRWMEAIAPCLPYLDLFIPSRDEAHVLSGKETLEEMADFFLSQGVTLCVIKDGKNGCYVRHADGRAFHSPTFDRIKPVDTSGAGDSFVAGFLTGLARNLPLEECAELGNAVGTFCVSEYGTTTGVSSFENTVRFIEDYRRGEESPPAVYRIPHIDQ